MNNRDAEIQSYRETERQSNGVTDETKETDDIPPLATSVKTLQEAVQISLKEGVIENCLFIFSRALKAFEITNDRRLSQLDLQGVFSLWWNTAKPFLPLGADFDEYRFDFEDTFAKTNAPLGSNSLEEAVRRADASPLPPQAERYTSPKLKRLIAVCFQLQNLQGSSSFFLSVRAAARIMGMKNLYQVNALMGGLVRDGILIETEKGTRRRATRFRVNLPELASTDGAEAKPAHSLSRTTNDHPQSLAAASKSKAVNTSSPTKPTTYELVERKKALQSLINELPHPDFRQADHRLQYKKLKKELTQVNTMLAGVTD